MYYSPSIYVVKKGLLRGRLPEHKLSFGGSQGRRFRDFKGLGNFPQEEISIDPRKACKVVGVS